MTFKTSKEGWSIQQGSFVSSEAANNLSEGKSDSRDYDGTGSPTEMVLLMEEPLDEGLGTLAHELNHMKEMDEGSTLEYEAHNLGTTEGRYHSEENASNFSTQVASEVNASNKGKIKVKPNVYTLTPTQKKKNEQIRIDYESSK
jgi:hypothetical protein